MKKILIVLGIFLFVLFLIIGCSHNPTTASYGTPTPTYSMYFTVTGSGLSSSYISCLDPGSSINLSGYYSLPFTSSIYTVHSGESYNIMAETGSLYGQSVTLNVYLNGTFWKTDTVISLGSMEIASLAGNF